MFTYSSYYYLIFLVDQAPNRMPFTLIQNLSKFILKKIFILKLFFGLQLLPINVFILSYVFLQPCPMTFNIIRAISYCNQAIARCCEFKEHRKWAESSHNILARYSRQISAQQIG